VYNKIGGTFWGFVCSPLSPKPLRFSRRDLLRPFDKIWQSNTSPRNMSDLSLLKIFSEDNGLLSNSFRFSSPDNDKWKDLSWSIEISKAKDKNKRREYLE
jgi:hypothetical protein